MVKKTHKAKNKNAGKKHGKLFLSAGLFGFEGLVSVAVILTLCGFVAHFLNFQFAVILGVLSIFGLGLVYELSSRRAWEDKLLKRLDEMSDERARLARSVANIRDEMEDTKAVLVRAGDEARRISQANKHQLRRKNFKRSVEERMIKSIADELAALRAEEEHIQKPLVLSATPLGAVSADQGVVPLSAVVNVKGTSQDGLLSAIKAAVKQDRIDMFIQPVVNLPQRKLHFYEMLSRVPDGAGKVISARDYMPVAKEHNLMSSIDNLLLLRGLKLVRDMEGQEPSFNRAFFCNITPTTLKDPKFMGDLVEFLSRNRNLAPRLVFEMPQSAYQGLSEDEMAVLNGLSGLGCRFSMDFVVDLSFKMKDLQTYNIRYIKLDKALLFDEMEEIGGLRRLHHLKSELDSRGIDMIVEKIETEKELVELLDLDINYGQGYLFGTPELYAA